MSKAPTIYLVDDDQTNLKLVSNYLTQAGYQVHAFTSSTAFLEITLADPPGCIILDNMMPSLTGVQVQDRLLANGAALPVIFLSGHSSYEDVHTATLNGAIAFLQKPVPKAKLYAAVEKALAHSVSRIQQQSAKVDDMARYESLSEREQEVFKLLVEGKSNKMISRKLDIALRTVEFHRANIQKKLQVAFLSELIALAKNLEL